MESNLRAILIVGENHVFEKMLLQIYANGGHFISALIC